MGKRGHRKASPIPSIFSSVQPDEFDKKMLLKVGTFFDNWKTV